MIVYDMIWYNMIWLIWYDMIWYDMIDMIWYDMTWYDMERYDMIWYDMIWYDMIWYDMMKIKEWRFQGSACWTNWNGQLHIRSCEELCLSLLLFFLFIGIEWLLILLL